MASAESDCEDDGNSVACSEILFRGGVVDQVAEPRLLCLDELLSIYGNIQGMSNPKPAKIIWILFRSEDGLGVWGLAGGQSHVEWHMRACFRKVAEGSEGYFSALVGRILDPGAEVENVGLGDMSEVVFHRTVGGSSV